MTQIFTQIASLHRILSVEDAFAFMFSEAVNVTGNASLILQLKSAKIRLLSIASGKHYRNAFATV